MMIEQATRLYSAYHQWQKKKIITLSLYTDYLSSNKCQFIHLYGHAHTHVTRMYLFKMRVSHRSLSGHTVFFLPLLWLFSFYWFIDWHRYVISIQTKHLLKQNDLMVHLKDFEGWRYALSHLLKLPCFRIFSRILQSIKHRLVSYLNLGTYIQCMFYTQEK